MKKILRIVLSSFALITLVSCGTSTSSSSEIKSSSVNPDSSETSSSSKEESSQKSDVSSSSSSSSSASSQSSSSSSSSSSSQASSTSSSSSSSKIETKYHVTFVNYDDSVLYETDVLAGSEATYVGETPTKPDDDEFTYEFKEWDKDLSSISGDVTTKAVYTAKGKEGWGPIIWF